MDELIMTSSFWPFFLALCGVTLTWLLRFGLNDRIFANQTKFGFAYREKVGVETEYLLGHISAYTLRMVKVD